jgi:hypothetical protein
LPFTALGFVLGLTLGTTYWFDAIVYNVGGGTSSIVNGALLAWEF